MEEIEKRMKLQIEEAVEIAIQKTKAYEQERYQTMLNIYQKQQNEIIEVCLSNFTNNSSESDHIKLILHRKVF